MTVPDPTRNADDQDAPTTPMGQMVSECFASFEVATAP
jgi:hypothetical protein